MADTIVPHKITWPYELVYTTRSQPSPYDHLYVVLFVNGYIAVMEKETESIKLLMAHHLQELIFPLKKNPLFHHNKNKQSHFTA